MKTKLFATAFAAFMLASCASKPGDVTKITGVVNDAAVTEVKVFHNGVDTTLAVTDGKFYIELPADVASYGMLMSADRKYGTYLISDGTEMELVFENEDITVNSKPEYVQSAYSAYSAKAEAFAEAKDTEGAEALWFETVKANPANAIATLVVSDAMYELAPEKMIELISEIQEPVRSSRFVAMREKEANAQLNTKPGMMFTDFAVEHVYGYDRSVDPQPLKKQVKFSDYVGKGTYVLVDFWSPWCGPCRREIPNIQKVYNDYKKKGLEILSIAVWERKPQSHTIETAAELGMDWHHINNAQSVPTDIYGISGIPHIIVFGPDGTILSRGKQGEELKSAVDAILTK